MRLLLLSNSTAPGRGYLDHCADAIVTFLGSSVHRVLFVPDAVFDRASYVPRVRARFDAMGYELVSIHDATAGAIPAIEVAEALFIGGGNTFRLIDALWRERLIEPIRRRVEAGMPYVGVSAGSNVACPSIRTTNDMPIVEPPSFDALGVVPFQINPHYQDPEKGSLHMGETREQRIAEFHEESGLPVVGLREGAWLLVEGTTITLLGTATARVFRRGEPPVEVSSGARLEALIGPPDPPSAQTTLGVPSGESR